MKDFFVKYSKHILLIVFALEVLALLLNTPLTTSLWLDESITAWVTSGSYSDLLHRTWVYECKSPLYFTIIWLIRFFSDSEFLLRLPSLIASIASVYFLYKLVNLWFGDIDSRAGLMAIIIFIAQDTFLKSAVSARQYGLLLLFSILSVYFLALWLRSNKKSHLIFYTASVILLFYAHYLYLPILFLHFLQCITYRDNEKKAAKTLSKWFACVFIITLFCIPGLYHLYLVFLRSDLYIFSNPPGFTQLLTKTFNPYICTLTLIGLLFGGIAASFSLPSKIKIREWGLIAIWCIFPPVLVFCYSHLTSNNILSWRFILWQTPAIACLGAALICLYTKEKSRTYAALTIALLVILIPREWNIDDYKSLTTQLNLIHAEEPETPIFVHTGLVEMDRVSWLQNPTYSDYLKAPFLYYGATFTPTYLPSGYCTDDTKKYFNEHIKGIAQNAKHFYVAFPRTTPIRNCPKTNIQKKTFTSYHTEYFANEANSTPIEEMNFGILRLVKFSKTSLKQS